MTTVPRRRPKISSAPPEPWPSYAEPEPRVTTEGKVSGLPSPIQACWAEAIGRVKEHPAEWSGEVEGPPRAHPASTCASFRISAQIVVTTK
jgi:hypothetical protein